MLHVTPCPQPVLVADTRTQQPVCAVHTRTNLSAQQPGHPGRLLRAKSARGLLPGGGPGRVAHRSSLSSAGCQAQGEARQPHQEAGTRNGGGGRGCAPMNTTEYTNLLHTWRPWRSSCPPHPVHSCLDLKPSQGKVVRTASRFLPSLRGRGLGTTGATYQTGEGRLPPHAPPVCADSLRHPVCPPAEARAQERLSESLKQSGPGGERGAGRPVHSLQERAS